MKILYFITKSNFGGAQRYVYDLAKMAKNKGFSVEVAGGAKGELAHKLEKENVPYHQIESLGRNINLLSDLKSFFHILRLIKTIRPDVVHFNSSKMAIGIWAARILKFFYHVPKKIIFTAHGWPFNEERPYWQKKAIWFVSLLSILFSDTTITVARYDFEKGTEMVNDNKKLVYIPNGIDSLNFYPREMARHQLEDAISLDLKNVTVIGTIAELTKNKGLTYLLETAKNLSGHNLIFLIIGDGEDKKDLQKKIIELGLQQKFILIGKIENAFEILPGFDAFILPSVKEGLPYAILEAGQAELPVIATSVGGIPEIIEDMRTGILIRKKDHSEIERAITYILENPENSKQFGHNLKLKVEKEFNLSNMATETFQLYKEA